MCNLFTFFCSGTFSRCQASSHCLSRTPWGIVMASGSSGQPSLSGEGCSSSSPGKAGPALLLTPSFWGEYLPTPPSFPTEGLRIMEGKFSLKSNLICGQRQLLEAHPREPFSVFLQPGLGFLWMSPAHPHHQEAQVQLPDGFERDRTSQSLRVQACFPQRQRLLLAPMFIHLPP